MGSSAAAGGRKAGISALQAEAGHEAELQDQLGHLRVRRPPHEAAQAGPGQSADLAPGQGRDRICSHQARAFRQMLLRARGRGRAC